MKATEKLLTFLKYFIGLIIGLLFIFPIYYLIISSLKSSDAIFDMNIFPNFSTLSLENYRIVLEEENFGQYIYNSFYVSTIVTVVALVFHSMSGYALARLRFKGKQQIFLWIISTLMIPFSVILIPLFIIVRAMNLNNNLWGVILPMIPNAYGIFLYRQFFLGIPRDLEEAAKVDGASHFGTFIRIILPLAKPITATLAVSFFVANWNNYLWPLTIAQDRELWMVQIAIANFQSSQSTAWNLILASSVIAALPIILMFILLQKYFVAGIKTAGIKG